MRKLTKTLMPFVCCLNAFYCGLVYANVDVYPIELGVGENGASQIQVISKSDQVSFVKITEKKIINPGTPQEKEIPVDMTSEGALVVTPQKLAISPGSKRIVRLISVNLPEKETTWRVYFEGVSEDEFNSNSGGIKPGKSAAQVGVSIVWGALVHVAPLHPLASLKIDGKTGKLVNSGTVRIPLTEIGECDSTGACNWHEEGATIYPDTQVHIKSFSYQSGKLYKVRYKDWLNDKNKEISLPVIPGSE